MSKNVENEIEEVKESKKGIVNFIKDNAFFIAVIAATVAGAAIKGCIINDERYHDGYVAGYDCAERRHLEDSTEETEED